MTKLVIGGLLLAMLACGGDSDEGEEPMQMQMQVREGPVGCYIAAEMMCDCELAEEECIEAAGMFWTPGCMSCEM